MLSKLLLLSSISAAQAAETVLGVYIFHRHGDRTAKAWPPANLTALGADEVYSSGAWFRSNYIDSDGDRQIKGISSDVAVLSQLATTAPVDNVLQSSAIVFLQGLYPPTGDVELLANGSKVEAPLGGYQYIPVNAVTTAASSSGSEDSAWLQGSSGCGNAEVSSNEYFSTPEYLSTYNGSYDFYQSLLPVINGTYNSSEANFENAYTIFDLINVAEIHNTSITDDQLLTNATFNRLFSLASIHEWNLAYNASEPVRAISGSVLGGQILDALQSIVDGDKVPKFNIQFGAYGTFMSFFGLAQMLDASPDFMGIVDYASSMTFELVTNATDPSEDDVSVRFYFANGTAAMHEPALFPLFGQDDTTISWSDFKSGMSNFSIVDTQHWCTLCGNTDGTCASNSTSSGSDNGASSSSSGGGNGVSKPVAGVIGALVTLVVVLAVEGAVMLIGGLRLAKKSTLAAGSAAAASGGGVKA